MAATRTKTNRRINFDAVAQRIETIASEVAKVIEGKDEAIRLALIGLLSGGHLLIEDVPGVGKTMMAKGLARATSCSWNRIQFTPDLLPSDVTGVSIYNNKTGKFDFRPGAVFANLVLADEINRASPKTQSALLEAMEERQVTVDGETYVLEEPFMVMATQNPFEHEGIFPLPQSQVDRFTMRIHLGYPSGDAELEMLDTHGEGAGLDEVEAVASVSDVVTLMRVAASIKVAEQLKRYIVGICNATREQKGIELGASPRAALYLLRTCRTRAAADGRDYVLPDDIKALVAPVLMHRLVLTPESELTGATAQDLLEEAWSRVPVPPVDGRA